MGLKYPCIQFWKEGEIQMGKIWFQFSPPHLGEREKPFNSPLPPPTTQSHQKPTVNYPLLFFSPPVFFLQAVLHLSLAVNFSDSTIHLVSTDRSPLAVRFHGNTKSKQQTEAGCWGDDEAAGGNWSCQRGGDDEGPEEKRLPVHWWRGKKLGFWFPKWNFGMQNLGFTVFQPLFLLGGFDFFLGLSIDCTTPPFCNAC